MRSFVVPVVALPLLLLVAACPKPLPPEDSWTPVKGADSGGGEAPEQVAQREKLRQIALEARVNKMRAALISADEARCSVDDDCALTSFHCCGCSAGGKAAAVHKDKLAEVLQRRGVVCGEYACAQVVSDDPTCAATHAVCREGKCVPEVRASTGEPKGLGTGPIQGDASE